MTGLARITRGPFGFDIQTFECSVCDEIHQRVGDRGDPMKSGVVAGWLRGELRATKRPPRLAFNSSLVRKTQGGHLAAAAL
jgi:hypothetical protein